MSLANRTVALAEGRQLEDLVQLLDKEQAKSLRFPLLSILDPVDDAPALEWVEDLVGDRFDLAVFMTGEGIRRLLKCAERHGRRDEVVAALGRVTSVTRGPKPGKALGEIGLKPTHSPRPRRPRRRPDVARRPTARRSASALCCQPVSVDFLRAAAARRSSSYRMRWRACRPRRGADRDHVKITSPSSRARRRSIGCSMAQEKGSLPQQQLARMKVESLSTVADNSAQAWSAHPE